MSTPYPITSLRRTLSVLAVAAGTLAAHDAAAQATVTLTGANGNSCTYSSLSVTPNGNVAVQCQGTVQPPPPQVPTFQFTAATMTATPNSNAQATVSRTGATTGAFTQYFWYEGAGCARTEAGALNWGDGDGNSKTISIPMGASGVCTATLATPTAPAVLGTIKSIAVTAQETQQPPPPTGCPATPTNMLTASLGGIGNLLFQMQASGQVVSIKLPKMNGRATGQVTFGESAGGAYTPQPVNVEISINKCPGVIDTNTSNFCNVRSSNGHYNSITWMAKPYGGLNGSNSNQYGYCWSPESDGDYYVNARWTYNSCAFGAQVCGFAIQYNEGPY